MAARKPHFIDAVAAKTQFFHLLEMVEAGDAVTITRHGLPVACLVPNERATTAAERREAIEGIKKLGAKLRLGGTKIRDLIDEGRR